MPQGPTRRSALSPPFVAAAVTLSVAKRTLAMILDTLWLATENRTGANYDEDIP
jgi:hypothetical protein